MFSQYYAILTNFRFCLVILIILIETHCLHLLAEYLIILLAFINYIVYATRNRQKFDQKCQTNIHACIVPSCYMFFRRSEYEKSTIFHRYEIRPDFHQLSVRFSLLNQLISLRLLIILNS